MSDFIFLGSKLTVDGDCSHEIKRRLLLGRKVIKGFGVLVRNKETLCAVGGNVNYGILYGHFSKK